MKGNTSKVLKLALVTGALTMGALSHATISDEIRDNGVQTGVEIRMLLQEGVPSENVDVHVSKNIIQLAGFVDNTTQYRKVDLVATKYMHDYKVINNVKVLSVKDEVNDETRLRDDVKRHLKDRKYPVENIDVQVRNGHVILSGFVNKHVPLKDLKAISKEVPGVKEVDNYLLYKQV